MMVNQLAWGSGQWQEGVARLKLPWARTLNEERTIMINNSSLGKWRRLAQKQLDQQFIHEIIHGLNCSQFEASAILDTVYRVYASYFETSGSLKPDPCQNKSVSSVSNLQSNCNAALRTLPHSPIWSTR